MVIVSVILSCVIRKIVYQKNLEHQKEIENLPVEDFFDEDGEEHKDKQFIYRFYLDPLELR
jgi:hypothetical protein